MPERVSSLKFDIAEHIEAMLAYWDKDLVCRYANLAYIDWFGIDPASMIDKITLKELLGAMYEKNLPYINEVLKGNKQVFDREIVSPSGKVRQSIAAYIPDIENGRVVGFYAHIADVTNIKNRVSTQPITAPDLPSKNVIEAVEKMLRLRLLSEFPGVSNIAKHHFISESKLKRDFKRRYNKSIFSYYRHLQMQVAYELINEKKYSKKEVSVMLNFLNPSNFSVCYQKYLNEKNTQRLIDGILKENDLKYKTFITQSPFAIAMFDTNLRHLAASEKWITEYGLQNIELVGKTVYDIFPNIKEKWEKIYHNCLKGNIYSKAEERFRKPDGMAFWLRCDIRPWYIDKKKVGGLLIFTEDITSLKLHEAENKKILHILDKTNEIARIGVWKRNFINNTWLISKIAREILEVPPTFEPGPELNLNFYKEGESLKRATKAMNDAIYEGIPFDYEAEIITAKGNAKRIRVIGYPEFYEGTCEKLFGIFQELKSNK